MNFTHLFFLSKSPLKADPVWLLVTIAVWAVFWIALSIWGPKIWSKDRALAAHKTLKKSSFWLKFFGIAALILLWFRLEAIRFFSMNFWWVLYVFFFLLLFVMRIGYYIKLRRRIARREHMTE